IGTPSDCQGSVVSGPSHTRMSTIFWGVPIIGRRLTLETAGSQAQIAQWEAYMGDAVISTG
ncbi:hypothetical protein KI387_004104, partial [Taxus chinensis]